ncbi:MAG: GIY-YIG nuclease family protein [Candidatus Cyclobacteriaceae bacterium M2_1C_046]
MKSGETYILSNFNRIVFYIGSTNDLETRVLEHRYLNGSKFTTKYRCFYLVYFESFSNIQDAVDRERQLKNWKREWKINLIKEQNPTLEDLSAKWYTDEDIRIFREVNNTK